MDWQQTEDDAEFMRCPNAGRPVCEVDDLGRARERIACAEHTGDVPAGALS